LEVVKVGEAIRRKIDGEKGRMGVKYEGFM
jgi:hypothetical protein